MKSVKTLIVPAILLVLALTQTTAADEKEQVKVTVPCSKNAKDTPEAMKALGISRPTMAMRDAQSDAIVAARDDLAKRFADLLLNLLDYDVVEVVNGDTLRGKAGDRAVVGDISKKVTSTYMTEECSQFSKDLKTETYVAYFLGSIPIKKTLSAAEASMDGPMKTRLHRKASMGKMDKYLAANQGEAQPSSAQSSTAQSSTAKPAAAATDAPSAASTLPAFDEALAAVTKELGATVRGKIDTVVVMRIETPGLDSAVSIFLTDELSSRLIKSGKFKVMERNETSLKAVSKEHVFQMSGMADETKAIGVGKYLNAKVVITGTFSRFEGFSQLRLAAIDVKTAARLAMPSARIRPDDKVLAGVIGSANSVKPAAITEDALAHLNNGKDLLEKNNYDKAINELNNAIQINADVAETYFYRGSAYYRKGNKDKAIADLEKALRLNPSDAFVKQSLENIRQERSAKK